MLAAFGSAPEPRAFITGSDRGLSLEFAKQYAAGGDTVMATCRNPDKASTLQALAASPF